MRNMVQEFTKFQYELALHDFITGKPYNIPYNCTIGAISRESNPYILTDLHRLNLAHHNN